MCAATQSFGVVCLRRGERESETGKKEGKEEKEEKEGKREEVVERESAGNVLSVSGLMVVACCFQKQAYTLNVLSCSELGAEFAGLVAGLVPHEVCVG